jgi:hypothetical protein
MVDVIPEARAPEAPVETPRTMTRDQFIEMIEKMKDVGSVELKVAVPGRQRAALVGLNLDVLQGRIREVYFFDTPELTLFENGVVPRARRTQGTPDDTVVKIRPCDPTTLPPEFRNSPNMKVEMDITRGSYVVSASLKGERGDGAVKEAVAGKRPLAKLFTKEQRAFFDKYAPKGVTWSDLVTLGPAYVVVLKHRPLDLGRKLTIEQWHYPGEIPLVELSTKTTADGVLQTYTEASAFLKKHGLQAQGEQEPKTRKALEFFSKQRAAAG